MRVIVPGSYDPITLGHLEIIRSIAEKYDEVFVVAFVNTEKIYTFTPQERVKMLSLATEDIPNVRVDFSSGLVVDYMKKHSIEKIVKGYRNDADLEYEMKQAKFNLKRGYDTELIKCQEGFENISSTAAREAIGENLPLESLLPEAVMDFIKKR